MRTWALLLLLALSACGAADRSGPRPPRSPAATSRNLRAGDKLRLGLFDDPWLSEALDAELTLDREGAAYVPYCGRTPFVGLSPGEVGRKVGDCLVDAGFYVEPPPVVASIRSGSSATLFVGPERRPRVVPFEPGLTLVQALVQGLEMAPGKFPRRVVLRRKGASYVVDTEAIVNGSEVDEPIEPGDEITIEADVPSRPADRSRADTAPSRVDLASKAGEAGCGDLVLEEIGLVAIGMGDRHPHVIEVRKAILATCSDETGGASLLAACLRVREENARGKYGPRHPRARVLDAQLRLCPMPVGRTPAPGAAECAALRAEREALAAAGKGERHPRVIAVTVQLEGCP